MPIVWASVQIATITSVTALIPLYMYIHDFFSGKLSNFVILLLKQYNLFNFLQSITQHGNSSKFLFEIFNVVSDL